MYILNFASHGVTGKMSNVSQVYPRKMPEELDKTEEVIACPVAEVYSGKGGTHAPSLVSSRSDGKGKGDCATSTVPFPSIWLRPLEKQYPVVISSF